MIGIASGGMFCTNMLRLVPVPHPSLRVFKPARHRHCRQRTEATPVDADVASDLIASGATTQSLDTVVAVLSAHRDGASINAAAKASGINYRTAQRIVEAAVERRQGQLVAAS
jgi:hypothetical protein